MIRQQHHIIRRNIVTVDACVSDGLALQSTISRILNGEVMDRLAHLFDTVSEEEKWLVIDTLEINIHTNSIEDLETNFADLIIQKVKEQLQHRVAAVEENNTTTISYNQEQSESKMISSPDRALEAFIYFLEKGNLPWWFDVISHTQFESELLSLFQALAVEKQYDVVEKYLTTLSKILKQETTARRLVHQFGKDVVMAVLTFMMRLHPDLEASAVQGAYEEIVKIIRIRKTIASKNIWPQLDAWLIQKIAIPGGASKLIIAEWLGEIIYRLYQNDPEYIIKSIEKNRVLKRYIPIPLPAPDLLANMDFDSVFSSTKPSAVRDLSFKYSHQDPEKHDVSMSKAGVQVNNAGLVVVAPFLEHFFSTTNLLTEGLINDNSKALALLHYMVFGNLDYHEYDLVLPKILCGVDAKEPIEIIRFLTVEELDHTNDLLRSIIENWSALKTTSPDGLRETFLQRNGMLTFNDNMWSLQVEQNTVDILLESLPWTIGYIKLPWMEKLLKTQWT